MKKVTTKTLMTMKKKNQKITMLTAYDYPTAKILDEAGIDMILVGDSLGMVVLGYEDTTKVTMDDMAHHTKAVTRATNRAFVVADMPFLSYHLDNVTAIKNAGRLIRECNANAVKVEGGKEITGVVKSIVRANIPVVGHLGITPQSVLVSGGYYIGNKNSNQVTKLLEDALALQEAGVCAIVLECVPYEVAKIVSERLSIPTIGIGSGVDCDGQVLVINDILGAFHGKTAKFVKQYANINDLIKGSAESYISDVKDCSFPAEEHGFKIEKEILEAANINGEVNENN